MNNIPKYVQYIFLIIVYNMKEMNKNSEKKLKGFTCSFIMYDHKL